MSKKSKLLALIFASSLLFSACGQSQLPVNYEDGDLDINTPWEDYSVPAASVTFTAGEDNLTIEKGETHNYQFTISPKDAKASVLFWESADENIASVDNGVLTAVNPGQTVITVDCPSYPSFKKVTLDVNVKVTPTDFSISPSSLDLDYNEKIKLDVAFLPADATFKDVSFKSNDETIVTVDDNGLVEAKAKSGTTTIEVTSTFLDVTKTVNVVVSDKTIHVEKVEFVGEKARNIELLEEMQLEAVVSPDNATHKEILYSSSDEEVLSVSNTGLVKALKEGHASVTVTARDNKTDVIDFTVYEVKAESMRFETATLSIANDDENHGQHQLTYTYETNIDGRNDPTYEEVTWSSSNENVASVSETGLLTAISNGVATIKVENPHYDIYAEIGVKVTINATSLSLTASPSTIAHNGKTTLTAQLSPAGASNEITFEITEGQDLASLSVNGNKATLTADSEAGGLVKVIAHANGLDSNEVTITVKEKEVIFEADTVYLVGSSDYSTGSSNPNGGASWENARKAYKFTEKTANENAVYEYRGLLTLNEGDEWKIRVGYDWKEPEGWVSGDGWGYQIGRYKTDQGAFASGAATISGDNKTNGNVKILKTGEYEVYYAFYENDKAEGWYEVAVNEYSLSVDKLTVNVAIAGSESIKASNWAGTLTCEIADTAIATVEKVDDHGNYTISGVAEGTTTLTFQDDENVVVVTIKVSDSIIGETKYYLVGSFNDWTVSDTWQLTAVDENHYTINEVQLNEGTEIKVVDSNDTWFSNSSTYPNCYYTIGSDNNVVVSYTGAYTIDLYINSDQNNHVILTYHGTAPVSRDFTIYFTNNYAWGSLKAYVWNDASGQKLSDWPGVDMEWAFNNDQSQAVYKITIDLNLYDRIIFTSDDGSKKTKDIDITDIDTAGYNAFYIAGEDGGVYTVGTWNH